MARKPDHPRIAPIQQGIRLIAHQGGLEDGPRQSPLNHEFLKDVESGHEEQWVTEKIHSANLGHDIPRLSAGKEPFPAPVDDSILGASLIEKAEDSEQEGSFSIPSMCFKYDLSEEVGRKGIHGSDENCRHKGISFQKAALLLLWNGSSCSCANMRKPRSNLLQDGKIIAFFKRSGYTSLFQSCGRRNYYQGILGQQWLLGDALAELEWSP